MKKKDEELSKLFLTKRNLTLRPNHGFIINKGRPKGK